MLMDEGGLSDAALFRAVQAEIDVQRFVTEDPVGKYLFDRAKNAALEAALALGGQSIKDARENFEETYAEMQFPIRLLEWVTEAQNAGSLAREALHSRDEQEKF